MMIVSYISCPASLTLANCEGKLSMECAGTNQVVLMLYFDQRLKRRSMPTVAPKIPREMSVGFAGEPSLVFNLVFRQWKFCG